MKTMPRRALYIALAISLLVVVASLVAKRVIRGPLPDRAGDDEEDGTNVWIEIRDADGVPVSGACVLIEGAGYAEASVMRSEGPLVKRSLPDGDYAVRVVLSDAKAAPAQSQEADWARVFSKADVVQTFSVHGRGRRVVVARAPRRANGDLLCRVFFTSGAPAAGLDLMICEAADPEWRSARVAIANGAGEVRFDDLHCGLQNIRLANLPRSSSAMVTLNFNGARSLVVLPPVVDHARCSGTLCNDKGRPVANVALRTRSWVNSGRREGVSDQAGHFDLGLVPCGGIVVSAHIQGEWTVIADAVNDGTSLSVKLPVGPVGGH